MTSVMSLSDSEIKHAIGIFTLDPTDPDAAGHHLWGERPSIASDELPEDKHPALEIELPSDDHIALLKLIDRIERVKGSLPPDVVVLRANLRG